MSGAERSLLIEDAAELLGLSRRTVYYRIRDGRLTTIRTRCGSQRVLLSSIERLLREMRGLPRLSPPALLQAPGGPPKAPVGAARDRAAAV